jgi:tetratricopeptide (TPR) repeat protein
MASKVQFVKQETDWLAFIPKLFVLGILSYCLYPLDNRAFLLMAFCIYFLITLLAKCLFLPNSLYQSIKFIKEAKFDEAIPPTEQTIEYYTKHSWIDKFRFHLLISSSKRTIRESSICNLAYCYLQTGNVQRAKEIYQDVLRQYPENINAKTVLNTITLIQNDKT